MRKAPLRRPVSLLPFLWETRKVLNGFFGSAIIVAECYISYQIGMDLIVKLFHLKSR